MNYGGDAADQIVRYSMEGMEHTLTDQREHCKESGGADRCSNEGPEKDQGKDQPASDVKGTAGNEIFHHSP